MQLYKKISARRYIALTVSNFASVVQERLGMYNFLCAPEVIRKVNCQKSVLSSCIQDGL